MNNGLTAQNLLASLPPVLANDEHMAALAASIADTLAARTGEIRRILMYPAIDDLPEALLDILAHDFHVDWYGYNYPIEAKRALIKGSVHVHRGLGTKGAVKEALSSLYPGSSVSEWYEYGGDPYYFRIVLDITNQFMEISHNEIVKTVNIYKSMRSRLEDDAIVYRTRCIFDIGLRSGYVVYSARLCGTYPARATQGSIEDSGISAETSAAGVSYSVPMCGTSPGSIL